jgi:hypothetical protein
MDLVISSKTFCFLFNRLVTIACTFYPWLDRRVCGALLALVRLHCHVSQQSNEEDGVVFHRNFCSWNYLTLYSLKQHSCLEVKASKLIWAWKLIRVNFCDSVCGLIIFRRILIRSYVFFFILVHIYLFRKNNSHFLSCKWGSEKVAQAFPLIQSPRGDRAW